MTLQENDAAAIDINTAQILTSRLRPAPCCFITRQLRERLLTWLLFYFISRDNTSSVTGLAPPLYLYTYRPTPRGRPICLKIRRRYRYSI